MIRPNEEIEIAALYIPVATVEGSEVVKVAVKWVLVFSRHITIEHENGIYRRVKSPCETPGLVSL